MVRHLNPSGFVYYDNEKELYKELEKLYFPTFFDVGWKPILENTKEVWISQHKRIDYYGLKNNKNTFVEVKNWFVRKKDIIQIIYYKKILGKQKLFLICGGIDPDRNQLLIKYDIETILTKDIKELNPMEVVYWM